MQFPLCCSSLPTPSPILCHVFLGKSSDTSLELPCLWRPDTARVFRLPCSWLPSSGTGHDDLHKHPFTCCQCNTSLLGGQRVRVQCCSFSEAGRYWDRLGLLWAVIACRLVCCRTRCMDRSNLFLLLPLPFLSSLPCKAVSLDGHTWEVAALWPSYPQSNLAACCQDSFVCQLQAPSVHLFWCHQRFRFFCTLLTHGGAQRAVSFLLPRSGCASHSAALHPALLLFLPKGHAKAIPPGPAAACSTNHCWTPVLLGIIATEHARCAGAAALVMPTCPLDPLAN